MVLFNDKPIEKGKVIFALEGKAPSAIDIVDGKFSGKAMVGSNRVSVSAKKKVANPPKLPANAQIQLRGYQEKFKHAKNEGAGTIADFDGALVEFIPSDWGSKSTQTCMIKPDITNEVEFKIKGPRN